MTVWISWDEFEKRLIEAGWSPEEAHEERLRNEHGDMTRMMEPSQVIERITLSEETDALVRELNSVTAPITYQPDFCHRVAKELTRLDLEIKELERQLEWGGDYD